MIGRHPGGMTQNQFRGGGGASRSSGSKFMLLGGFVLAMLTWFSLGSVKVEEDILLQQKKEIKTVHLADLLSVGLGLSAQAAEAIRKVKTEHKEHMKEKGLTDEGVVEPVTDADYKSNAIFMNGFRNHFPGIELVSEETEPPVDSSIYVGTSPLTKALDWNPELDLSRTLVEIDPLDATKEFSEDLLSYVTTMVCIIYDDRPIAGIIYQVFEEDPPVVGIVGSMDGGRGQIQGRPNWGPAHGEAASKIAISRSHTGAGGSVVEKYLDGSTALLAGGAGYKALLVLDGKATGYVHVTKIKAWDVCAADAVLRAAGGGFTDVNGKVLSYGKGDPVFTDGIVAAQTKDDHVKLVQALGGRLT